MSVAFSRGVCTVALATGLSVLLAVACTQEQSEEASAPAERTQSLQQGSPPSLQRRPSADLRSLLGKATLPLTSNGKALVPVTPTRGTQADAVSPSLGMQLPLSAEGRTLLHPAQQPDRWLALAPLNTNKASALLSRDGSAVYERAFAGTDVVAGASLEGLRTQIAIHDAASPDVFVWRAELAEGLRPMPRDDLGTDLVDDQGSVWLSVSPVTLTDAHGVGLDLPLAFGSDGFARIHIDQRGLAYPALLDFDVTLGAGVRALAVVPTQIKGRVMVLLDTSGSMIWQFGSNTGTGGDSPPGAAVVCDNVLGGGSTFTCGANLACTVANGGRPYWPVANAANPSRMLAAKLALSNVVNANAGLIDFGLERYAEADDCVNPLYCCNPQAAARGLCRDVGEYADLPGTGTGNDLSYNGGCGTPYLGGRVLVQPGPTSSPQLVPWVDFVEDFCSSTGVVGDAPRNPELRGSGSTPLGRSIITARESWYRPVYNDSVNGTVQLDDDPLIDCRPYALVVMTDGDDTCQAGDTHAIDCAASTADCFGNFCHDINGNIAQDTMRCACSATSPCTGPDQTCALTTRNQDCAADNTQCTSGNCFDPSGGGDNWRCSCATSADCGAGMVCNTVGAPLMDCHAQTGQCAATSTCVDPPGGGTNYFCTCTTDAQCPTTQVCDVAGGGYCRARGVCQSAGVCEITEPLPRAQVQRLTDINVGNPVKTYVLGMGDPAGLNQVELDAMAVAGGTDSARFASSQAEIEAAFADIVSETVKYELCNTLDDNCNDRNDEGLGVYQECSVAGDCSGGACDHGRCACNGNAQCGAGYACSNEAERFCRPTCSVGIGECFRAGLRKCGAGPGECCVNDSSATCTKLNPGVGVAETCNLKDDNCNGFVDENLPCQGCIPLPEVCDGEDNDCDGAIDEPENTGTPEIDGLVDVGGPCGSSVGRCTPGTAVCVMGELDCQGDTGPFAETCNGRDDDCDGVIDGMTRACYTGPAATRDVPVCHDGTQICAVVTPDVENWGACVGEQLPTPEVCNGLDDNCDGIVDNGVPAPKPNQFTGDECCGDGVSDAQCGVGQCSKGEWACAGNVVVCANAGRPTNELCDDVDNDCNAVKDDIPSLGGPCVAAGSCSGKLACDSATKEIVCLPDGTAGIEKCDSIDNDCDGKIDEIEDVQINDEWWGDECQPPPVGHEEPPCQAGQYVCKNGNQTCEGAVGPLPEVCDLKDTDCDGVADTLADCPGSTACVQGVCVEACRAGEFPCPGGYSCESFGDKRYCVPHTCNSVECPPGASCHEGKCTLDPASGGAGNAGGAGNEPDPGPGPGSGGVDGQAGAGDGPDPGAQAGAGNAGPGSGGSSSSAGTGSIKPSDPQGVYGLVTGGGGCACRTTPTRGGAWAMGLSLVLLGSALSRRRRSSRRRAA